MKKKYLKPDICFESFRLSTDISAGCDYFSHHAETQCVITFPDMDGVAVFNETLNTCDTYMAGPNDQICYHSPLPGMAVFTS